MATRSPREPKQAPEILDGDAAAQSAMAERANGRRTVPQIFIGDHHVGGCDDLHALESAGKLDPLLA